MSVTSLSYSHELTRDEIIARYRDRRQAQKYLSAAEVIYQQSQPKRHKLPAELTREIMKQTIQE